MRIEQSQVGLASRRVAIVTDMTRSSMEAWIGDRPAQTRSTISPSASARGAETAAIAQLSAEARSAARNAARLTLPRAGTAVKGAAPSGVPDSTDPIANDPKLSVLIMLIERLTGQKVHLIRLGDVPTDADAAAQQAGDQAAAAVASAAAQNANPQPQKAGWGVEVHVEQIHQETETTGFTAVGQVVTADGRTISFEYQLDMHRELSQTSTTDIQAGDAVKKVDPVALNLSGGAGPAELCPVGLRPRLRRHTRTGGPARGRHLLPGSRP